jgi:hypothetical protein
VDNLYFGAKARRRARRRARLRRFAIPGWILSVAVVSLGVPGYSGGLDLLSDRSKALIQTASAVPDPGAVESSHSHQSSLHFRRQSFAARPDPKPAPQETAAAEPEQTAAGEPEAPPAPAGSVEEIIHAAAAEYGIDPGYMVSIAACESGLNPGAYSPAGYYGLFQYDQSTWSANGYGSIYDPVAQSRTTARLLAAGQSSRWPNCA